MLLKKMSGAPIFLTLTKFLENNRLTILPIKSHDCHYVVHSAMFVLVWAFKCDNKNKSCADAGGTLPNQNKSETGLIEFTLLQLHYEVVEIHEQKLY